MAFIKLTGLGGNALYVNINSIACITEISKEETFIWVMSFDEGVYVKEDPASILERLRSFGTVI